MRPEFATPRHRLEHIVMLCWSEVLGRSDIGADENFFDVGGSSLHAVKLHALLRARLKADIPILALFEHPSVRGFVEMFAPRQPDAPRPSPLTAPAARPGLPTATALSPAERAARQHAACQSRRGRGAA
jgi:nonribosomal peptide synthetase DhbF